MRPLAPIAIAAVLAACSARASTITIPGDFPSLRAAFETGLGLGTEIILLPGEHRLTGLAGSNSKELFENSNPPDLITSTDPNDPSVVSSTVIINDGYLFSSFMTVRGLTFRAGDDPSAALPALGRPSAGTQDLGTTFTVDRCVIDARGASWGVNHGSGWYTQLQLNDSTVIGDENTLYGVNVFYAFQESSILMDRCLVVGCQTGVWVSAFSDPDGVSPKVRDARLEISNSVLANRIADIDVRGCAQVTFPYDGTCAGFGPTAFLNMTLRNTTAVAGIAGADTPLLIFNGDIRFVNSITASLPGDLRPGGASDNLVDTFGFFEHDPGGAGPGYPYSTGGDARFIDELGPDGAPGTGDEDLRLRPQSPAIDAGIGFFINTATDIAGLPRRVDDPATPDFWDDFGTPPAPDAGAHEFQPPQACSVADVTTINTNPSDAFYGQPDGTVDGADLSYFVENWLGQNAVADVSTSNTNPGEPGYGSPDGAVDGADLSFFVENWLAGCP